LNADYYQSNANEYISKIISLDIQYKETLANCESKEIIYGGHYAFGYLANRYNLKYFAAQGISPDAEPTALDMITLIEQIKSNNIKYIFYEELSSSKVAETIANETNANLLLLNAAHNVTREDIENNVSFITIMKENLENLKTGLQCVDSN
jgi:zinc transport system substrate-binding protein